MEIRGKEQMRFAYAIIDPHRAWRELRADVACKKGGMTYRPHAKGRRCIASKDA